MDKDEMIRLYNVHRGTWPALLGVYGVVVGGFLATAWAMV